MRGLQTKNVRSHLVKNLFRWVGATIFLVLPFKATALDLLSVPDVSFVAPASAGGDSYATCISPDGRYVLFSSAAENLAVRTNGVPYVTPRLMAMNVFLRDRIMGTTTLVSADSTDTKEANCAMVPLGLSTNGQYVLFESETSNLVANSSNRFVNTDIFVRNLATKITRLVTIATNGEGANAIFSDSTMTPDGRYVAFSSEANNLVADDTNGIVDVFVRDLELGVTRLVSVGAVGTSPLSVSPYGTSTSVSDSPAITPDGRFASFISTATNLLPGITTIGEVYVRDLSNNTTFCVSTNAHQFVAGNIACYNQKISDDGEFIVFQASAATSPANAIILRHHVQTGMDDLVASNAIPSISYKNADLLDITPDGRFVAFIATNNSSTGVFVWDAQTATTVLASVGTNGALPTNVDCGYPIITGNGRFVVFVCNATNLTTNSVGAGYHFYRRDLLAGVTELIDAGTNGSAPARNFLLEDCTMSADGRFVAFDCADPDLVTNDSNYASDVFVRDLGTETTELVSVRQPSMSSRTSVRKFVSGGVNMSADGRYLTFAATGSGLVGDYTNTCRDIFVRDLLAQSNFLVSVDTNGVGDANHDSTETVISSDGRYVAFTSYATNLVAHDTNNDSDVFVRDLQAATTTLASVNSSHTGPLSLGSSSPSISSDGRYVLFLSGASAILRDQVMGTNYVISTNGTTSVAMTPDGRFVGFYGIRYGLSPSLYVWDSQLKQTIYSNSVSSVSKLNISSNGQWLAYVSLSTIRVIDRIAKSNKAVSSGALGAHVGLRFSLDGRFLVYATDSSNTVDDTNLTSDVYVYDVLAGNNSLISRSFYSGQAPNGASSSPDISADARYIVYSSRASDIVPNDDNRQNDIFLYDRQTGLTTLLSVSSQRQNSANFPSLLPIFTGDGQTVVFHTWASDIVENDFNQGDDLFLMKILSTNASSTSTNPPPVFAGELVYQPNSSGESPRINWTANPGVTYQIQFKNDLTDPDWQLVNGNAVVEGNLGSIMDLAPNPDHRFYRIVGF